MIVSTQKIADAALKLPDRERLQVAAAIWKSLGATDDLIGDLAALARSHEVESGKVTAKTQAEVFGNARAVL